MIRTWLVDGMDCSGCKTTIERSLAKLPGVESGQVNFLSRRMTVTFDEGTTSAETIGSAVARLGFEVTPETERAPEPPQSGHDHAGNDHAGHDHAGHSHSDDDHAAPAPAVKSAARTTGQVWWNARAKQVVVGIAFVAASALASLVFENPSAANAAWSTAALLAGWPVFAKAFKAARAGSWFSIEALMTVATFGAIAIGAAEEATMVVVLFLIGEWLESVAAAKARSNIGALLSLAPERARRIVGGTVHEVALGALTPGDVVEVRPGDRVPTDGIALTGHSALDESLLTGESIPVARGPGDTLTAGTLNTDGVLTFRVTKSARDNTLARILHLVEDAETQRSPVARFIDAFSQRYTPVVFAVALMVAVLPPLFLPGATFTTWIYRGLGLLLIGCPCALVLSVPAAVTAAIAQGARRGLLIKGGAALEALGTATHVAFDKTGTLTHGRLSIAGVFPVPGVDEPALLRLAALVEAASTHPVAKAIVAAAGTLSAESAAPAISATSATSARALPGAGMEATVDGKLVAVLSPRAAAARLSFGAAELERITEQETLGRTIVAVLEGQGADAVHKGFIALCDTTRAEAGATIARLRAMGLSVSVLTGDNRRAGDALGHALGIEVRSELSPAGKLEALAARKTTDKVVMVGDGINDAPALAASDVGIAMGLGTDVAVETADAVLHGDSIKGVADVIELARRARSIIRQNVIVALGLKGIFLVTTIAGITGLWLAVLSDTGATVLVTLNALRLLSGSSRSS